MINDPEVPVPPTEPLIPQRETNQLNKGTAGIMVVSVFMFILSIFLMLPFGPHNTDATFNIQERIFLIFASTMLLIATIVEGICVMGDCCSFGVAAAAVFLPSSILYTFTDLNSTSFWNSATMFSASVLLTLSGALYLAHYIFILLLEVPKRRIVSGIAAGFRMVASVLFMVAGIVELGQTERGGESTYDFTIFRNLMFSGAAIHAVAAVVAAVGQFIDPSL